MCLNAYICVCFLALAGWSCLGFTKNPSPCGSNSNRYGWPFWFATSWLCFRFHWLFWLIEFSVTLLRLLRPSQWWHSQWGSLGSLSLATQTQLKRFWTARILLIDLLRSQLMFHKAMGFAPFGEYWRNLRRISATYLFSPKRIAHFGEFRRRIGLSMVDEIKVLMKIK